jgi:hypothetical protein
VPVVRSDELGNQDHSDGELFPPRVVARLEVECVQKRSELCVLEPFEVDVD